LKRASRLVVYLDFFGSRPDFTFEFLGRREKIERRYQRGIHVRKERLFLKPFKAVIAGIFPDDRPVFLFNETVVVFLVIPLTGERDVFFFAPDFCGVVDKFRAVVAAASLPMKLQNWERGGGFDIRKSLKRP
jgi:hypothetical protein